MTRFTQDNCDILIQTSDATELMLLEEIAIYKRFLLFIVLLNLQKINLFSNQRKF